MGKAIGAVATGGMSLVAPAVGKKLGLSLDDEQGAYMTPEQQRQKEYQAFLADSGSQLGSAEKKVQYGDFTGGLYNPETGLQQQVTKEGRDLANKGFQLNQEDREAYGQASGDIARQFGQQEQDLSQSLARRGLASAGSGAAGAGFSGLAGNKNEMLAKAQMQIADKRMQNTQQRLQQNRQMQQDLATQGINFRQNEYNTKKNALAGAGEVEQNLNSQNAQALADKEAAVKPGLFSTIGSGLQAGIGQLATKAPSMGLGMATGGQYGTASASQQNDIANASKRKYSLGG